MAKKYLNLEEAAELLGLSTDEVKKLRQDGALRGFQDGGNWKFREADLTEYRRSNQMESTEDLSTDLSSDDDAPLSLGASDSDVRLLADDLLDSDSDVKLLGGDDLLDDSDSDVKLAAPDHTDSDIRLAETEATFKLPDIDEDKSPLPAADDVGSGISLEVVGSGAMLLGEDSGISLEIDDSGISLEADDSGISLEAYGSDSPIGDDSGISLEAGDSGISLEFDDDDDSPADMGNTMPMDVVPSAQQMLSDAGATTELHMPAVAARADSDFELAGLDDDDSDGSSTNVLTFENDFEGPSTEVAAGLDDSAAEVGGDLNYDESGYSDDDDYEDFDEDYDDYDEYGDSASLEDDDGFSTGGGAVSTGTVTIRRSDVDWGIGTKMMIGLSAVLSITCAVVGAELIRTMWLWTQPGSDIPNSQMLDLIASMF